MYEDRNILVRYHPDMDRYSVFFKSSGLGQSPTRIFLDYRLLEEFSKSSVLYFSERLSLISPLLPITLMDKDVEKFHRAFIKAIGGFEERS